MSILFPVIKIVGSIVVAAICVFIVFFIATSINKEITKGSAYGFAVGMTKNEAFYAAKENYKEKEIYIVLPLNHDDYEPNKVINFTKSDYSMLKNENYWTFSFSKNNVDQLVLFFKANKIAIIARHRKYFELP